jgi:hypothetical protein
MPGAGSALFYSTGSTIAAAENAGDGARNGIRNRPNAADSRFHSI